MLELGCGTGRVLIPTARAGIDIIGLDLSPSMLSGRTFNLVTIPFRALLRRTPPHHAMP